MEGDLTWGGEYTIQYTDGTLQNCIPETYTILLTDVTSINSIKNLKKIIETLRICREKRI